MDGIISRRTLLRNGGAGLVAIGATGLAGCTGSLPLVGGDNSGSNVERWLVDTSFIDLFDDGEFTDRYTDGELESDEQTDHSFSVVVPEAIFENEHDIDTYLPLQLGADLRDRVGITASDLDWQL